ncbi:MULTISPECIES: phage tail protein [Methylomonas]|uniref:Phage tail protein n=1 Tax=Methylomonas koyamae TaxID=702114 RepID=A0A177NQL6_9GAMM|nr:MULTISPECIES: phage tail protein [Methylomonas]ANE56763.1 phage tail protein [Methylomonas sp. DH-1]OAI19340.1 phage tail protein [Methylomonas koyamae]
MAEAEIYRNYNFILDWGGQNGAYFTEIDGLSIDVETIDYREGGAAPAVRKLEGRVAYGNVILRWGVSDNKDVWNWLMQSMRGKADRREISIILLKPYGQSEEATRWNLHNAWPCKWKGARLESLGQGVAIQTLEIAHEGLEQR